MWSSCSLFSPAMTWGNPSCQTVVIKWITTLSKWGREVLFSASQAYAHLACHTILSNEGLCDKLKGYLLTLLPHISCYNVWVPRLARNGPSVDAKSLEEFRFLSLFFLFCFKTTALRRHLFSWLEPWCQFHKLSYNPYCTVACSVGERRWWVHTVSALHSSLQADSQIPLDLCIVLSTNYHCLKN